MTESEMTAKINQRVRKMGVHAWKINANFAKGVPDCWYSGNAKDLWVEYKHLPKPPKRQFTIDLSPLQAQWLRERYAEGRNVAVVVTWDTGFYATKDCKYFNTKCIIKLACAPQNAIMINEIEQRSTAQAVAEWLSSEVNRHEKERRKPP